MKEEIWKAVVGYEGLYEVSNLGSVRGITRIAESARFKNGFRSVPGKIIKPHLVNNYYSVGICKSGVHKGMRVHRLVAMAFIPNPLKKPTVNHIDASKLNNEVENLEWATHREQNSHASKLGLMKSQKGIKTGRTGALSSNGKEVFKYTLENVFIKKYPSVRQAGIEENLWDSLISACARGVSKSYAGYIWKYSFTETN